MDSADSSGAVLGGPEAPFFGRSGQAIRRAAGHATNQGTVAGSDMPAHGNVNHTGTLHVSASPVALPLDTTGMERRRSSAKLFGHGCPLALPMRL